MEGFNRKIKKFFPEKEDSIPADFGWEDMKSGIYGKMDKKPSKERKFLPFVLVFVLISFVAAFLYEKSEKVETQSSFGDNASSLKKDFASKLTPPVETNKLTDKNIVKKQVNSSRQVNNSLAVPNASYNQIVSNSFVQKNKTVGSNNVVAPNQIAHILDNINEELPGKINREIELIPSRKIQKIVFDKELLRFVLPKNQNTKVLENPFYYVGFNLGTNFGLVKENTYVQHRLGANMALNFGYQTAKKTYLQLGLNYENQSSKFDFYKEYPIDRDTTIVTAINYSLISNTSSSTSSKVKVPGVIKRRVLKYNTVNIYSLNLEVGKKWNIAQLDISLGFGGQLAIVNQHFGKNLNENGDVITYKDNRYHPKWAGFYTLGLGYPISSSLDINCRFNQTQFFNNWKKGGHYKPNAIGLSIGIRKKF